MKLFQLYNELYLGKAIKILFSSKREADTFRSNLSHYKAVQDIALDAFVGNEEQTSMSSKWDAVTHTMMFRLVPKKEKGGKEYNVTIIDDETLPDGTSSFSTEGGTPST